MKNQVSRTITVNGCNVVESINEALLSVRKTQNPIVEGSIYYDGDPEFYVKLKPKSLIKSAYEEDKLSALFDSEQLKELSKIDTCLTNYYNKRGDDPKKSALRKLSGRFTPMKCSLPNIYVDNNEEHITTSQILEDLKNRKYKIDFIVVSFINLWRFKNYKGTTPMINQIRVRTVKQENIKPPTDDIFMD